MVIKGLLYFDLDCWNGDQRASLLRSRLLKCRSNGFSTSIWTVEMVIEGLFYFNLEWSWNGDQRAFLLQSGLLPAKSQNLGLDFKWWELCCSLVFEMRDFHLSLLDLNFFIFIKKSLIDFCGFLKKFLFLKLEAWNWKLEILNLKLWNFETWDFGLKLGTWNLRFENLQLEISDWNLEPEIWDFEILQLEILKIATSDFENLIFWKLEF